MSPVWDAAGDSLACLLDKCNVGTILRDPRVTTGEAVAKFPSPGKDRGPLA